MNGEGGLAPAVDIGVEAKPPFVLLPDLISVFRYRSERLSALSDGHPMSDYLQFVAHIAAAQHSALGRLPVGTLPGKEELRRSREHGLPPMSRAGVGTDAAFEAALEHILSAMADDDLPPEARASIAEIRTADEADRNAIAGRLLAGTVLAEDAGKVPFVMAALQVAWTRAAALLDAGDIVPLETPDACPVCGSTAVASIVHAGGHLSNVRFLCCPLCAVQWYYVRAKCSACGGEKSVAYYEVEGGNGAVKAETCGECRSYLKIINRNKDPGGEPVADDLASIALDILVADDGWQRPSPNPFLIPI